MVGAHVIQPNLTERMPQHLPATLTGGGVNVWINTNKESETGVLNNVERGRLKLIIRYQQHL